jgi:hypothetical protein
VRYALLVYDDQSGTGEVGGPERAALRAGATPQWLALSEQLARADPRASGRELAAAHDARVVRVRDGRTLVTDGPFAETREQLRGVFVAELPDLDEAIRLAAFVPSTDHGATEIRPLTR